MDTSIPWSARLGVLAEWPGRYGGADCALELWLDAEGHLQGRFSSGSERLEVQVTGGGSDTIYGFLLEPGETTAVAVFRTSRDGDGLTLELDVPDGYGLDFSDAERLRLLRLERSPPGKGGEADLNR